MGIIKLGDKVKMDPENSGPYAQFLKKGDGVIIGIHAMGQKDLEKTARALPLRDVGHLTVRCDNGIVIVVGPSRLAEINGYKRPDEQEVRRTIPGKRQAIRIGPTPKHPIKKTTKKRIPKRVPRKKSLLDSLWGET